MMRARIRELQSVGVLGLRSWLNFSTYSMEEQKSKKSEIHISASLRLNYCNRIWYLSFLFFLFFLIFGYNYVISSICVLSPALYQARAFFLFLPIFHFLFSVVGHGHLNKFKWLLTAKKKKKCWYLLHCHCAFYFYHILGRFEIYSDE